MYEHVTGVWMPDMLDIDAAIAYVMNTSLNNAISKEISSAKYIFSGNIDK